MAALRAHRVPSNIYSLSSIPSAQHHSTSPQRKTTDTTFNMTDTQANKADEHPKTQLECATALVPGLSQSDLQKLLLEVAQRLQPSVKVVRPADLGPKFKAGWNNLPDELKVRILSNLVVLDEPINRKHPFIGPESTSPTIFTYLRMTPEIATLSKEIFYAENTFYLEPHYNENCDYDGPTREALVRPTLSVLSSFIRRLSISVRLLDGEWDFLFLLAQGSSKMENLRYVRVAIDMDWVWDEGHPGQSCFVSFDGEKVLDYQDVTFECAGELQCLPYVREGVNSVELQAVVQRLITFTNKLREDEEKDA